VTHAALLEFDDMGILRATQVPPRLAWMTSAHIELLLAVVIRGEEGLPRRRTLKFARMAEDPVRQLELRDYVQWERDRRGRFAYLCLTWKGDEAARMLLKVAHHEQRAGAFSRPEPEDTCSS
jgi:hypothetical protein